MAQSKEDLEDFYSTTDPWKEPCWFWGGTITSNGYGLTSLGKYAHRMSYETYVGEIPDGLLIRHKCDERTCIQPAHLETGTLKDNVRDMVERGRSAKGEQHSQVKLTEAQVKKIRLLKGSMTNVAISKLFNVHRTCIDKINRGEHWRHINAV